MSYSEKLCDERHERIEKSLDELRLFTKELRRISWGVLIILCLSLIIGVVKGDPLLTSKLIINIVQMFTG
jgi:hypothetical protein